MMNDTRAIKIDKDTMMPLVGLGTFKREVSLHIHVVFELR